ncbi:MAG: hypothetical protein JSS86_02530 [Cyanobacteria bacterium SZAS LIN-2]|nr:hypothetical protein [Cyanobacteria bacterium SZAS LIN-3]MBS1995152.1 hypothetical protein [Cyanobacteria bacterium SZAS LIN-2]MBS2007653.1 hypothetical protein [Cyanobacteria bacterium SZAS TMP-1]
MFIILMVFFFPFLNLIGMTVEYGDCLYLNSLVLRQATLEHLLKMDTSAVPPTLTTDLSCSTDPNGSLNTIIKAWMNGGLGQFASSGVMPVQTINVDLTEGTPRCKYVHLDLNVECKPFLNIPFFLRIPGLNAPMMFKFHSRGVIENVPS